MADRTGSSDHLLYNKLLTNVIYEKGMGEAGIADRIAPRVRSTNITGQYMKRKRGTKSANVNTKRAPGAAVQTGERPDKSMHTFRTVDHALSELIPQEITSGMEETELMGERRATAMEVLRKIEHDWEVDVHDIVWAEDQASFEAKYPDGNVITPSASWNAGSGVNMKLDLLTLRTQIYQRSGKIPNVMVLPNEVFNVISTEDNELRDSLKYTSGGPVTLQKLAAYFEMGEVLVPMYLTDSPEGDNEDEAMPFLWTGDHIGLFHVDRTPSRRKDTIATTFYWDSPEQKFLATYTGWNRKRKSEEVEVGAYFTVEEIDMSCGGIITNVLS